MGVSWLVQNGTKVTFPLRWLITNCLGMPRPCNDSSMLRRVRNCRRYYPRNAMLARVIAINVSVCPSVTRRYCVKTNNASVIISSLPGSPKTLVFWRQISSPNSKGSPRTEASSKGRVRKFSDFLAFSVNISKTVADTAKVTNSD